MDGIWLAGIFLATFGTGYLVVRQRYRLLVLRQADSISRRGPWVQGSDPYFDEQKRTPFRQRVIQPLAARVGGFLVRLTPHGILQRIGKRLLEAGQPMTVPQFLLLHAAALLPVPFLVPLAAVNPLLLPLGVLVLLVAPEAWLSARIRKRQTAFLRALPDLMDLLAIATEAGLGFEMALGRVVRQFPDPVGSEMMTVLRDIGLGITRADALASLALRINVPELRGFVGAIIQGEELGVGISRILKIQSAYLRKKRWQAAQAKVAKIPVKLLFPMVLFIFPAFLVVLLGPIFLSLNTSAL